MKLFYIFTGYTKFPNCAQRMHTNLFLDYSFLDWAFEVHSTYGFFPNFDILCKNPFLFHVQSFFIFSPRTQNFQIVLSVCIQIFFGMFLFWIFHLKFTVRTVSFQTLIFYVKALFPSCMKLFYLFTAYQISKLCSAYVYESFFVCFFFGFYRQCSRYVWFLSKLRYFMWSLVFVSCRKL